MLDQASFAISGVASNAHSYRVEAPARSEISLSFALVVVFLIALYSQVGLLVEGLAAIGPMNILGGITIVAVVLQRLITRRGMEMVWPESYLLLAFGASAFLSCLTALWPKYALESTLDLLKYMTLYFLILQTVDSPRRLRIVLWTLTLSTLFPAVGTLKGYLQGTVVEGRALWIGIFGNPNEVAYSLVIMVPIAAYLAVTSSGWVRIGLWLLMATLGAAIYVTYSRGGMLGLLAVVALLGFRWRSLPVILVSVLVLAASLAFMVYGWTRGDGFTGLGADLSLQQRLTTFQGAWAMFLENPLSGVGLGCSLIAWPLYAPAGLYTRSWLVIHNTFLQALCETGLLGLLSFVGCLAGGLIHTRDISRQAANAESTETRLLGTALAVSLCGLIICGMSGGYVLTWFPYILLALISVAYHISKKEPQGALVA